MTLVVLGLDALDPGLIDSERQSNLALEASRSIDTIVSSMGEPSTHELWPTIITGLPPEEHGLLLDEGVAWDSSVIRVASSISDVVLPDSVQAKLGAWILNNTSEDAFRAPASYYAENGLETVFDNRKSKAIGVPNYVVEDEPDREHLLRQRMGDLFERDAGAPGGHRSSDPYEFYEQCLEMAMIRIARARRALRSCSYEIVFGYTSGLDLVGHVSSDIPELQKRAYEEMDEFVGELRSDLSEEDELVLVSDHGLQDGIHTEEAYIASESESLVSDVESVVDVQAAIDRELQSTTHRPAEQSHETTFSGSEEVKDHLEDLGYI